MYCLNSNKLDYSILLPTSMKEITIDKLQDLTKDVNLSNHYVLICILYKTNLFNLSSSITSGKLGDTVSVTPIIAKTSYTIDKDYNQTPVEGNIIIGNRPIIAPSVLERGYEVFIPTTASIQATCGYIQKDNDLRISLYQKKYEGNLKYYGVKNYTYDDIHKDNNIDIYLLSFKIVAENDIVATVPIAQNINDFSIIEKEN